MCDQLLMSLHLRYGRFRRDPVNATDGTLLAQLIDRNAAILFAMAAIVILCSPPMSAQAPSVLYAGNSDSTPSTTVSASAYRINPVGALSQVPGSPFLGTGIAGLNEASIAVTPDHKFLYVGRGTAVSAFRIDATTGALTQFPGLSSQFGAASGPWVAMHPSGKFLYVTGLFDSHVAGSVPQVGGYAIDPSSGSLTPLPGSPFGPTGASVAIDPTGKFVFVGAGSIAVYTVNANTGALTPVDGSPFPSSDFQFNYLSVHPSGRFVYALNLCSCGSNTISVYALDRVSGALTPVPGSPFRTEQPFRPSGTVVVDPTGRFAYVSNGGTNTISAFTIDPMMGALTPVPGSPFPTTIRLTGGAAIDSTGRFLYVSGGSLVTEDSLTFIAGYAIDVLTGGLVPVPGSPFPASALPIALTAIGLTQATGGTEIHLVLPTHGGNSGVVTARIGGNGFQNGAQVILRQLGQPDIVGTGKVFLNSGVLTPTFNLMGAAPGRWDVLVTNPDGTSASVPGGFAVDQGGAPQPWVDIIGSDALRVGGSQTFYITYGNRGDIDVYDAVMIVHLPKGIRYSMPALVPSGLPLPPGFDPNQLGFDTASDTVVPIYLYRVAVGSSGAIPITVTSPEGTSGIDLKVDFLIPPLSGFTLTGDFAEAPVNLWGLADALALATFEALHGVIIIGAPPGVGNVSSSAAAFASATVETSTVTCQPDDPTCELTALRDFFRETLRHLYADTAIAIPLGIVGVAAIAAFAFYGTGFWAAVGVVALPAAIGLFLAFATAHNGGLITSLKHIQLVTSRDPNDKVGSQGVGGQRYLSSVTPLRYVIDFANEGDATAPAQEVTVTDQLDIASDDLTTVSFGPIVLGDHVISPPTLQQSFVATLDMRPENNLIVSIQADVSVTGLLTWKFASFDPETGQPPTNPLAGFLPPGGGGSVFFTVMPKPKLSTNTEIQNNASITFDTNAPIATPVWLNTIDSDRPSSHVSMLPPITTSSNVLVQWSGADVGAGIHDYTVYVSEDGGPFNPFVSNTTQTSATFTGQAGKTYAFFSVARDLVDNVEEAKSLAEATTLIVTSDLAPPNITVLAPADGSNIADLAITVKGTVFDEGGVATLTVNGASVAVAPDGTFSAGVVLTPGANTITVIAVDTAGNVSTMSRHARANIVPPALVVTAPTNGLLTNAASIQMQGRATPADAQDAVTVTVQGHTVSVNNEGTFSTTVPLVDGTNMLTAVATDGYGLQTTTASIVVVDATAPVITVSGVFDGQISNAASLAPAFVSTDAHVGTTTATLDDVPFLSAAPVSAEGTHLLMVTATDLAGNQSRAQVRFTLDRTPPTIEGIRAPAPNANGWNNAPVTVAFRCSDGLSGLAPGSPPVPSIVSTQGAEQLVTGNCIDAAGNVASLTIHGISIDTTSPSVTYANSLNSYGVAQTIDITCNATDAVSGIAGSTCANITGPAYAFNVGIHSYSATAVDKAGNQGAGSVSFTITVDYADVIGLVRQFEMKAGVAEDMITTLQGAQAALARGNVKAANNQIELFCQQVSAQAGKSLTTAQATVLIQLARALKT